MIHFLQVWCTIASIAVQARAFELCSKAFIKLEALDVRYLNVWIHVVYFIMQFLDNVTFFLLLQPGAFENLAIEIFTRCKPKDAKGNKMDCPNCQAGIPEW